MPWGEDSLPEGGPHLMITSSGSLIRVTNSLQIHRFHDPPSIFSNLLEPFTELKKPLLPRDSQMENRTNGEPRVLRFQGLSGLSPPHSPLVCSVPLKVSESNVLGF